MKLNPNPEKFEVVEKEFHRGTLHSGSGQIVKNPKQAAAIAYSESGEKRKNDILPKNSYKDPLQSYGLSSLKNNNGAVTSPQEARQIAAQNSGQSQNRDPKDFNITQKDQKHADRYGIRRKHG